MRKLVAVLISLAALSIVGCGLFDSNEPPVIEKIELSRDNANPGEQISINVVANDPDGDELSYEYEVSSGEILGTGSIVSWKIEAGEPVQFLKVTVRDDDNVVQDSVSIKVGQGIQDCPFDIKVETGGADLAGILRGIITIKKDGTLVVGARVTLNNCTTSQSGTATTNVYGTVSFAPKDDPGGPYPLPEVRDGDITELTVTSGIEACTKCYRVVGLSNPAQTDWEEIPCSGGCL